MKQNLLLFVANRLFTPPVGSSHRKSTHFTLISLLALLMLTMGNVSAWADDYALNNPIGADGYYIVKWDCAKSTWASSNSMEIGQTFTFAIDITGNEYLLNIANQGHTIVFAHYGGDRWNEYTADCFRLKQISDNIYGATYNFKKDKPDWNSEKIWAYFWDGNEWNYNDHKINSPGKEGLFKWATNTGATSPDFTSEQIAANGGMPNNLQRNGYAAPCACEDTNGDDDESLQTLSENYCLRGDLWLNGTATDAGWASAGTTPSPAFTKNEDNTIATLKYVVPAISQGQILSRITLYGDDHSNYKNMSTVWDATNSNVVKDGSSNNEKGKLQIPQQVSFAPKQITLQVTNDGSGEKLKGTISDYTVKKNGWYLYVDKHCVGAMNSNGELIVSNSTYNSQGNHSVFIASSQRDDEISNPSAYWSQGISWFGGLYIDKNNCNVAWSSTQYRYYGDAFSNQEVFPTKDIRDGRGDFKLNSAADFVKYTFDGGKITINTLSKQQINDTYVLVGDYQGSWNNQDNNHKFSDNQYTKTISLTLEQNATGVQDKGANGKWFRFKGCKWNDWGTQLNRSNTTLIGDDNVIDKNNSFSDDDNRILVKAPYSTNVYTFTYYVLDGQNYLEISVTEYEEPAVTYTVTLHPNPNNDAETVVRSSVPNGSNSSASALNLSAITYGAGTATWYTDAARTTPFTTVTSDMDLYAKWGVSGNYWLVGDLWMYDTGSSWNNGDNPAFITTDGVATVTYIAPMGRNRFEIIKNNQWGEKINSGSYATVLNSASPVALSVADGHMEFTLTEMKKVTITYDGKVSVRAEAYDINKTGWNIAGNSGLVGTDWNTSACLMDANGEKILRNINTGNYEFKITPNGSWGVAAVNQFSAANVDKDNSTSNIFRNWTNHLFGSYKDGNEYKLPMNDKKDRNVCIQLTNEMAINGKVDLKIAFDGGKITVNVLPNYTVTFNSDGGSDVASQTMFEGRTATEPSAPTKDGYTFVKWQLSGSDYNFSSAVTGDIQLDAVWEAKAITSISLNETEHTTWVGNADFTLTPTLNPSDAIAKSVAWSSNAEGVATVSNGTVHAVAAGEATITCTVIDQHDNVRTATCTVTIAACEMTTDDLYSMTVTGYNTSTGSSATLTGLWNQSTDNTEPATFRIVKLKLSNNYYVYDDGGTVKMSTNADLAAAQWYEIPTAENYSPNWTDNSFALYEFKNVSTGKYMRRGNGRYGSNSDWFYYTTLADTRTTDGNQYKFFYDNTKDTHLVCREGADYNEGNTVSDLEKAFAIHNNNLNYANGYSEYCASPMVVCGYTNDPKNNTYTKLHETVVVNASYANPNYVLSQVNASYYRMNTDATVQANLGSALVKGAVITVRLYADAATSVKLTKTDGTEIAAIVLSADAALDYTYTLNTTSALLGESAFIIKAADNHAGIASITVTRTHAAHPSIPDFAWEGAATPNINQSALGNTFRYEASSTESTGAVSYTSSDETVATVDADGTVHPIKAGNTTITATIEEAECYAEATVSYNVILTEPTLAERIDADEGEGITLTHDYEENVVIDKAVTINGDGHTIGNLTVENEGNLTLSGNLTVNDFTICAKAGNSTNQAESGQVRDAGKLTVSGNAYFQYTVDPSGQVHYGWYDFTVPFKVNTATGIKAYDEDNGHAFNADFAYGKDYEIMEFLGDNLAQGKYSYKKFNGVMQPNKLYSITLDDDYNYNTLRFQMTTDGNFVSGNDVTLEGHAAAEGTRANWNGVGNGTLHHANVDAGEVSTVQVYQSGEKNFMPVGVNEKSFVVGSAFMVQATGTMTLNQATHAALLAPKRNGAIPSTVIQIAREGQPFSDQLFISADKASTRTYTQGVDVAKAGTFGGATVPQIGTNAYNTLLCAHRAQLVGGKAQYDLSIYAPATGTYTLTSNSVPEGMTLFLTQNGRVIWNLSMVDTYTFDLNKGITTEYGLTLVDDYNAPTGVDNISVNADETKKIMRNGILYILHDGKVFNAQGARVQ